ncbi:MAG: response regulator transcription factor [SAR202 cluster bacterium]|nr:response regulator transcription factor [SAR202 cluster bacterium]
MPPAGDTDVRVLVIADDHLARAGLAALLAEMAGVRVIGQLSGAEYVTVKTDVFAADASVWDLGWSTPSGVESLAAASGRSLPVVAPLPDDTHAADAWHPGARGLLLRDADSPTLLRAITAVAQGLAVFDLALSPAFSSSTRSDDRSGPVAVDLTPREKQVLLLMAEGLSNKAIASRISISEHTVKFHINAILSKLSAQSRTEAVTLATRMGLITL